MISNSALEELLLCALHIGEFFSAGVYIFIQLKDTAQAMLSVVATAT